MAEEVPAPLPWKGGISGLKVVFFFPLLPWEDIVKVVRQTSFSLKRGGDAEKEGFWPMRKGLGERFSIVFSLAVVVTDMELFISVACRGMLKPTEESERSPPKGTEPSNEKVSRRI
jgi:hypothetical protein